MCRQDEAEERALERLINWGATRVPPYTKEELVAVSTAFLEASETGEDGRYLHPIPPCVGHDNFSQKELDKEE